MADFAAEIRAVKEASQARLLAIPGVHSVGIGPKLTNGNRTGELSIVVWVLRKLPADSLPVDQIIPAEIDGIKTDVIEQAIPVIHRSGDKSHPAKEDGSTFDPLVGGCRIALEIDDLENLSGVVTRGGTLGFLATTKGGLPGIPAGMVVGVTNHHVLYGCTPDTGIGDKVGQPTPTDSCSKCCSDIIGRALVGRLVLDCALVALAPKLNYMAEVWGIGPIGGPHEVLANEIPVAGPDVYGVRKRGYKTGHTFGQIVSVNHSGVIERKGTPCHNYTNALAIVARDFQNYPFSDEGDSGSAIICDQGNDKGKVVGILFGGTDSYTLATHIEDVVTALSIDILTAENSGVILSVPVVANDPVFHDSAIATEGVQALNPAHDLMRVLGQTQAELAETADGKSYLDRAQLHQQELQNLIGKNRRVAAVWRRNGGPQFIQAFSRMVRFRDQVFPSEINGRPLQDSLAKIHKVLIRYSSPALSADITRLVGRLGQFTGLTYPQILSALQTSNGAD